MTNTSNVAFGEVVSVECEEGYRLMGPSEIRCDWIGWSNNPYCQEEPKASMSPLIIVIVTIATIIALAILVVSIYMLIKNCSFEKMKKTSAKAYEEKMRTISTCFGVSQDCVGMPEVTPDTWDDKIRGRSVSLSSSPNSQTPKQEPGKGQGLADHFQPDVAKQEFIY